MEPGERLEQAFVQSRGRKTLPRWAWWIISAVPVLFLLFGLGFVAEAVLFVSGAQSTRGQVVEIRRNYDDGSVNYTPTIRYSRGDGQTYEAETHIASSGYDYDLGTQVDILYSDDDPYVVRIDSFFSLYGVGLVFAVFGAVFLRIITWVRRRAQAGAPAGAAITVAERMREELHLRQDQEQEERHAEPTATDAGKREHAHAPKPKQTPTIRRMR